MLSKTMLRERECIPKVNEKSTTIVQNLVRSKEVGFFFAKYRQLSMINVYRYTFFTFFFTLTDYLLKAFLIRAKGIIVLEKFNKSVKKISRLNIFTAKTIQI